jgi:putative PEP-CTERM system histidine kinase
MIVYTFYVLNLLLLLSCVLALRLGADEQRLSLSLVQVLLGLLLLAGEYAYLFFHLETDVVPMVLFSESAFALLWFIMAHRLSRMSETMAQESRLIILTQCIGALVLAVAGFCGICRPVMQTFDGYLLSTHYYGPVYFYSIVLLISMLAAAWRLEVFWRSLASSRRWEYKFLVVGAYLVCGALGWAASYRLTYQRFISDHFLLLALLLLLAWLLMCYAVGRHRLLNRKMFISRKVVYAIVAPSVFATYLCLLGIISLVMRTFELPLYFVLRWLFVAMGLIAIGLFVCSGKLRRRIHFFISTHFYINKYEYRDEWLSLSRRLQGALSEADVVHAMHQVLAESLYATHLIIWLENTNIGYKPFDHPESNAGRKGAILPDDDPLVIYLKTHPYFYIKEKEPDQTWKRTMEQKADFLIDLNLVLISSLFIGDQLVGFIGLGPEFTGGHYGSDDFDLLAALGTQAASAILAVQMAEKLAHARERRAWDKLSTFVLHDIKNAASMLSLVRENASEHINNPEFQKDMLETVDDALARMGKIQERLSMLKEKISPELKELELTHYIKNFCSKLEKKLGKMEIKLNCREKILALTDHDLLSRILENLLLNAFEAGKGNRLTQINIQENNDHDQVLIEITDNGPGIPENMLPDTLFEPFATTKPRGTGIGLWQVKQLVTRLKGTISAENSEEGGARFVIRLPLSKDVE